MEVVISSKNCRLCIIVMFKITNSSYRTHLVSFAITLTTNRFDLKLDFG